MKNFLRDYWAVSSWLVVGGFVGFLLLTPLFYFFLLADPKGFGSIWRFAEATGLIFLFIVGCFSLLATFQYRLNRSMLVDNIERLRGGVHVKTVRDLECALSYLPNDMTVIYEPGALPNPKARIEQRDGKDCLVLSATS